MEYTIRKVADKMQMEPHVLRYYEKEGLLPDVKRTSSGYRSYSEDDLEWLGLINCLKHTGMSIKQIKEFVAISQMGDETLGQRCELLQAHKEIVQQHMAEMEHHLEKVTHKIEHYSKRYQTYKQDQAREKVHSSN